MIRFTFKQSTVIKPYSKNSNCIRLPLEPLYNLLINSIKVRDKKVFFSQKRGKAPCYIALYLQKYAYWKMVLLTRYFTLVFQLCRGDLIEPLLWTFLVAHFGYAGPENSLGGVNFWGGLFSFSRGREEQGILRNCPLELLCHTWPLKRELKLTATFQVGGVNQKSSKHVPR